MSGMIIAWVLVDPAQPAEEVVERGEGRDPWEHRRRQHEAEEDPAAAEPQPGGGVRGEDGEQQGEDRRGQGDDDAVPYGVAEVVNRAEDRLEGLEGDPARALLVGPDRKLDLADLDVVSLNLSRKLCSLPVPSLPAT